MRFAFLTVSVLALLVMSCSGGTTPTAPDSTIADLPTWTINYEGSDYIVGPGDLMSDRTLAVVDPGTDMTPDEIRLYFAVNITQTNFPGFWECTIFKYYMYPMLQTVPDEEIMAWVDVIEGEGFDVPNGPPPPPIC